MALAIFDLDNTLIADDSDHLWGEFIVEKGLVNADDYAKENTRFYNDYCNGQLVIEEYLAFALAFLAEHPIDALNAWRQQFIDEKIKPLVLPKAQALVEQHRNAGDTLLVITATNRFVTEPIVELFGIPNLLATEPEIINGLYTGRFIHEPCYQEGKVQRLNHWLTSQQHSLNNSYFYSDSHNDLPLLKKVTFPHAVNPDMSLETYAKQQHWPILDLR